MLLKMTELRPATASPSGGSSTQRAPILVRSHPARTRTRVVTAAAKNSAMSLPDHPPGDARRCALHARPASGRCEGPILWSFEPGSGVALVPLRTRVPTHRRHGVADAGPRTETSRSVARVTSRGGSSGSYGLVILEIYGDTARCQSYFSTYSSLPVEYLPAPLSSPKGLSRKKSNEVIVVFK